MVKKAFKFLVALLLVYIVASCTKAVVGMLIGFMLFNLPKLILSLVSVGICGVVAGKLFLSRKR